MARPISRMLIRVALDEAADSATRLEVWQDVMRAVGAISIPDPEGFTGEFVTRNFGDMLTVRVCGSTFRLTRCAGMARSMPREHVIVNLLAAGRWTGRLAGRAIAMHPGDVVLSQATNPIDMLMENATWYGLLVPRVVFEQHMRWSPRNDGTVYSAGTAHAALLGGLVTAVCSLPEALPPREIVRANTSSLALLLTCLGGAMPAGRTTKDGCGATSRAIRHFIVDRLADPALDVELICRTFELSRSRLYRLMRETGDVARLIRRLRLEGAANDLQQPDHGLHPIQAIAARWGFANERSFRRAMVREFGCAPSALRAGAGSASISGPIATNLRHWLLGL